MKPEDFRKIALPAGTRIGLIGDYGGESDWSNRAIVEGNVQAYIVVERHHNMGEPKDAVIWDAAMLVTLPTTLNSTYVLEQDTHSYRGDQLILLHRFWDDTAWDNQDPDVQVLGVKRGANFSEYRPLTKNEWRPKTVALSGAAILFVIDPGNLTEMAAGFLRKFGK